MIVDGLDTSRIYTADEVVAMREDGRLRGVTLKGWFFRWDIDKSGMKMVHVTDPTANRLGEPGGGRRVYTVPDPTDDMRAAVNADSPIVKRTPQERLASMTTKLMQGETGQEGAAKMLLDMLAGRNAGSMAGLTDEQVKAITGKSWKAGDPIDADTVRNVAARYLGEAERKVAETARTTTTKQGRKARREQERLERGEKQKWERRRRALEKNNENTRTIF